MKNDVQSFDVFLSSVVKFNTEPQVSAVSSAALRRSKLYFILDLLNRFSLLQYCDLILCFFWIFSDRSYRNFHRDKFYSIFAPTSNNIKVLRRVFNILEIDFHNISQNNSYRLRFSGLFSVFKYWKCFSNRRYRFETAERIQVLRAISAYGFFDSLSFPKIVFLANDHSPVSMALMHSAIKHESGLIYVQHGSVSDIFPPLICDLNILFNVQSFNVYNRHLLDIDTRRVLYLSPYIDSNIRVCVKNPSNIVVSLGVTPNFDGLRLLIDVIHKSFDKSEIFLRPHPRTPNSFVREAALVCGLNFSSVVLPPPDWRDVDLHFCGNSGVAVDALHYGVASFYFHQLDYLKYDYYGFVSEGVLPEVFPDECIRLGSLSAFYNEEWLERFKMYDHTLLQSVEQQECDLRLGYQVLCKKYGVIN